MRNAVNTWLGENASAVETRPLRQIVSQWIAHAWSSITEDTVLNMWAHLGFIEPTETEVPTQLADDMSTSVDKDESSVYLLASPSNKTTTTTMTICTPYYSSSNKNDYREDDILTLRSADDSSVGSSGN